VPIVESTTFIAAPVARVYAIAREIERFPEFMADVEEVEILEQTPERQVSRWVGHVKQLNRRIRWTEEDFWNEEKRECTFEQIEGDYSLFRGRWEFREVEGGTEAYMQIEYEYAVPLIGNLIKGVILKLTQQNIDGMLAGLKQRAESAE
jgi:ribosome-associated toxin RatA of RatAB toxin-antitoxin module